MSEASEAAPLSPWLQAPQSALLQSKAHALLIHGASGLGQYELALSLAQAWLCESESRQPTQAACGECASCQQIAARSHTDLVVLMPEVLMQTLGWPLDEKSQKEIDDKKRKPSREIRIDDVRQAVAFATLTSGRGRGKVILVYPAEALNTASANALLKTLEEPAPLLRFALASEAAHALLPTIRSRCQAYALPWPAKQEALNWLKAQAPKAHPSNIEIALQASGGRPGDALQLLNALESIAAPADSAWKKLPKDIQKGLHLSAQSPSARLLGQMSPAQVLGCLQKMGHDLWALKLGGSPRFFDAADLPRPPPARALQAWQEQLKNLARAIDHTWKPELLMEDLLAQAKIALNARQ